MPKGWIFKITNGFDVFGQAEILVLESDLGVARKMAEKIVAEDEDKTFADCMAPIPFDEKYYVNEGSSY
jgi:hypothetical protein